MKKPFRRVPLYLLGACVLCAGITAIRAQSVKRELSALQSGSLSLRPSVDFVQPFLLAGLTDEEYGQYFADLSAAGYDSVILQYTRVKSGGVCSIYYPSDGMYDYYDSVDFSNQHLLERLLDKAAEHGFKVWVGLSVDDDDWWGVKCYFDEEWMARLGEADAMMIREISALYGEHPAFYGWYWAHEIYSNPVRFENIWAKLLNTAIDAINETGDSRPLMLSPFRQVQSGYVTNEYRMWHRFFKAVHLRPGDVFAPQDSMGKLNQQHPKDPTALNYLLIYDYLNQVKRAVDEVPGLKLWVNVELFQALDHVRLTVGEPLRVRMQLVNAARVSEKLVTFSYSHYAAPQGTNGTPDERKALREAMEVK